jgi:hypothetical protein
MRDTLLFLHVLAAFMLVTSVVLSSAYVLGGAVNKPSRIVFTVLDGVGGLGTLIFGVWLALYLDEYKISDGWIIAAIVVWALAAETGRRAHEGVAMAPGSTGATAPTPTAVRLHWIYAVLVVALLVIMVYKPGA